MSFNKHFDYTYEFIQVIKKRGEVPNVVMYSKSIVEELKRGNYSNADELFKEMDALRGSVNEASQHQLKRIHGYQRALCSLVRYTPDPRQAQNYATFFFQDLKKPLRTPAVELIILTNLIYVYSAHGRMKEALSVIELCIKIGVFEIDPVIYSDGTRPTGFNDPIEVLESVSKKALKYHNLAFSQDRTKLVQFRF